MTYFPSVQGMLQKVHRKKSYFDCMMENTRENAYFKIYAWISKFISTHFNEFLWVFWSHLMSFLMRLMFTSFALVLYIHLVVIWLGLKSYSHVFDTGLWPECILQIFSTNFSTIFSSTLQYILQNRNRRTHCLKE